MGYKSVFKIRKNIVVLSAQNFYYGTSDNCNFMSVLFYPYT